MTDTFSNKLDKFVASLLSTRLGVKRELERGGPGVADCQNFMDLTHQLIIQLVCRHYKHASGDMDNKAVRCEINFEELKKLSAESAERRQRLDAANLKAV